MTGRNREAALFTEPQISQAVQDLARAVDGQCPDDFVMIVLMDGGMVFAADLLRALFGLGRNPQMGSLGLSSYGAGRQSRGVVRVTQELQMDISGRDVLIVDDVLESGASLEFARDYLIGRGANSVRSCALARKPYEGRKAQADFVGFDAPDKFLLGYGLDDDLRYRGQPYISGLS
ncbi:MAG: phosphoribosyltransferase family protein [Robiginitomaculum sp.]